MDYAIFTCRQTRDLAHTHGEQYGVYVPMMGTELVLPGLAFVPTEAARELRRRASPVYALRPLYTRIGNMLTVTAHELQVMQQRMDELQEVAQPSPLEVGQEVYICFPGTTNCDILATVVKFRSNGRVRVRLAKAQTYVELPRVMVRLAEKQQTSTPIPLPTPPQRAYSL